MRPYTVAWQSQPLEAGTATLPTVHPAPRDLPPRPGLVRVVERQTLAEGHEDVAAFVGWPSCGGWCE